MKEVLTRRLANLLSVKSIVTLTLTIVFAYTVITESISQDMMTIYMTIIAFYFGAQTEKASQQQGDNGNSK